MPIKRRDFVVAALSVGAAGTAYSWHSGAVTADDVSNVTGGVVSTPDPNAMVQELGAGFDRLEWQEDGTATIYWEEDHGMDGFYVLHEYDDDFQDSIEECAAPKFGGPITYDLVSMIQSTGYDYPTRRFELLGAKGGFPDCNEELSLGMSYLDERLGTAAFTVPNRFEI